MVARYQVKMFQVVHVFGDCHFCEIDDSQIFRYEVYPNSEQSCLWCGGYGVAVEIYDGRAEGPVSKDSGISAVAVTFIVLGVAVAFAIGGYALYTYRLRVSSH